MTIASDLLQRHFQTLVDDNAQWQALIADDIVWELPFAPALGHPARLNGAEGGGASHNLVPGGARKFPFLRPLGVSLRRSRGSSRRSQGGRTHQTHRAYLSPGLCAVPACCGR